MRLKDLRGLPVIDPGSARKIGTVVDYQVDPAVGRLAALDIDGVDQAESADPRRVLAQRIRRVGQHAVMLTPRAGSGPSLVADVDERWLDAATLPGLDVMGDDGNRVGRLADATFDQDSLDIEVYQLQGRGWERLIGRSRRLLPGVVQACSREMMLVASGRPAEVPRTALEDSPTRSLRTPLKADDRPAEPAPEPVQDGQTVGIPTS